MDPKIKIKEEAFSIVIIPEDHGATRRYRVFGWQVRAAAGLALSLVLFTSFAFFGFFYYRSLYRGLEADRRHNVRFDEERLALQAKLARLESDVERTEMFANKLAALVGSDREGMKTGIGPVTPPEHKPIPQRTREIPNNILATRDADQIEELAAKSAEIEARISELYELQQDRLSYVASTPTLWPVKGWVTSDFGYRSNPFGRARDFHAGIDIASQIGTGVTAPADGIVTFAGYRAGYGKMLVLDHGFGVTTRYGHNSALLVHEGQVVKRGALISRVGNTGHSTGPHLHYEVHVDGVAVDPLRYLIR